MRLRNLIYVDRHIHPHKYWFIYAIKDYTALNMLFKTKQSIMAKTSAVELAVFNSDAISFANRETALVANTIFVLAPQLFHKAKTPYAPGKYASVAYGLIFRVDDINNEDAEPIMEKEISWSKLTATYFGLASEVPEVGVKLNEENLLRPTMAATVTNYITRKHKFEEIKTGRKDKRGRDEAWNFIATPMTYKVGQSREYVGPNYKENPKGGYDVLSDGVYCTLEHRREPDLDYIQVPQKWIDRAAKIVPVGARPEDAAKLRK